MAYQDFFSSISPARKPPPPAFAIDPENPVAPVNPAAGFSFDPREQPFYKQSAYGTGVGQMAQPNTRQLQSGFLGASNTARNPYYANPDLQNGFTGLDANTVAMQLANTMKPNGGFGDYLNVAANSGYQGNAYELQSEMTLPGMPTSLGGSSQWWNPYAQTRPGEGALGPGGAPAAGGPGWEGVNQWSADIAAAAAKYGVPANLVASIMRLESGGNPGSSSPQGATGLMQIMPFWNGTQGLSIHNNQQNIQLGTYILKENFNRYGSWEMAAKAYLGLGGADAFGTTAGTYWPRIKGYWDELNARGGTGGGTGSSYAGTGQGVTGIFGGGSPRHSQPFGRTAFSTGEGAWMYGYAAGLGVPSGHPGIDYSMPSGSRVYIPAGGTVVRAGGSGSFRDSRGDGPGRGELRIQTDDGHLIIFGHMSNIPWSAGQRVSAGQLAGLTGNFNGDHLHLEVRVPGNTSTGWQAVDPEQYFGGMSIAYGGSGGGAQQQQGPAQTGSWWSQIYTR